MQIQLYLTTWDTGVTTKLQLSQYQFGLYIENMPIGLITIINTTTVTVSVYVQSTTKQYAEPYNTAFQILTQLIFQPTTVTQTLTGGTNFRYQGSLANISMSSMVTGTTFYILNQQVIGTSGSAAGYVTVPWTATYDETLTVASLGAASDTNLYSFTTDSSSQGIPGNVTSSNASMSWVVVDFYSQLSLTVSDNTVAIVYNGSNSDFECSTTETVTCVSTTMSNVAAPGTVLTNSLSYTTSSNYSITVPAQTTANANGVSAQTILLKVNFASSNYPATVTNTISGSYVPPATSIAAVTATKSDTIAYTFTFNVSGSWNSTTSVVTTTLTDSVSTAIPNATVTFTGTNCTVTPTSGVTNSSGQATTTVSSIGTGATVTQSVTLLGVTITTTTNV